MKNMDPADLALLKRVRALDNKHICWVCDEEVDNADYKQHKDSHGENKATSARTQELLALMGN